MRLLKSSGNYLKRKAEKSLAVGILFLIPFLALFITSIDILPFYIDFGRYETVRGLFIALFFIMGTLFLMYPFLNYMSGLSGERKVATILLETLNNEYSLLNDVILTNMENSNIDHIVVGPTGIFAIETKNNRGKISYYGDDWEGVNRRKPSKQARINAVKIHNILVASEALRPGATYVEGVVVFSHSKAELIEKKTT